MMRLVRLVHLYINVILWMRTVGNAHGNTVSPPWITLSGCFDLNSNNETSNIQKNEPTKCFEMCTGVQTVGLKNMSCICNPMYNPSDIRTNRRCNVTCPGKSEVYCGGDGVGNEMVSVYKRDVPLPDDTNGSSSYGYGYVVVSGSNRHYYASDNNMSLRCGYMCYDDVVSPRQDPCLLQKSTSFTWESAITECNARSARLITVSDVSKCHTGAAFDGTYWIGIYREKPDFTTSTTVTSTSTRATSTSSRSSKQTARFKPTTASSHNSTTPVVEQTSNASSNDGINVIAVAAPIAVIVVAFLAVLASILICKKRQILCFKGRHNSGELDESDSPPEIPELIASSTISSVPPGSTRATFQSHYTKSRPITARERNIQSGQIDQTVLHSNMYSTNTGDNTQNGNRSDIKDREKPKEKKGKKRVKKGKHGTIVDKVYDESEANGKTNVEMLDTLTNDILSAVNGRTGYLNGEGEDNDRKMKKKKKKRTREDSYSDDKMNNNSAEQHEILRETQIKTLAKEYDGLFFAPAETPVIEEHTDLNIERLGRKHKEKRRKDKERVHEDGAEQDDENLNEVYKESNDSNIDTRKEKKKKRKKSRERSKENALNYYDEIVDALAATPVLEERTDLKNEGSRKKHKKRKRKEKDKKRGDDDVTEQKGLDLDKDENDDATGH